MNCEYAEVFMKAENIRSLNKGNLLFFPDATLTDGTC